VTPARSPVDIRPHVLREYTLLADGERGAVVGPSGDIAWLCVPRWDSDSVFSSLIGGRGSYVVTPSDTHVWGGFYEEGSLIWRDRWITTSGILQCREALRYPADEHCVVVLRRLQADDTPARITVELTPRAGYDTEPLRDAHRHGDVWTGRVGGLYLRWTGAAEARAYDHGRTLGAEIELAPGEQRDLVLELSDQPLPDTPPNPDIEWQTTENAWASVVPDLSQTIAQRDARHSYVVLQGLTSRTNGTVAAATTSLPERAKAGRNYDYRYVWIRDQCYVGQAVAANGAFPLLTSALDFITDRLEQYGDQLAPGYCIDGEPIPKQRHLDLPGYPGGYDIVGNWVNEQFQLDAFGEALQLFAAADARGVLDTRHWKAVEIAVEAVANRWAEPDAGIWEIDNRPWTHSRLTVVAGLRAIAAAVPGAAKAGEWLSLADTILAHTAKTGMHPAGHWQRSPDDPGLDASLLLAGLRGAIPADDPRTVATLEAYMHDLTRDGYAYRFRHDDRPLHEAEGSFLLCGYLVALSLQQQGDHVGARAWFERTAAACGPPQLFSEEFDAHQHQMRGNLAQAFVHALMIETATRLAS
jgi:GH15 family glucan-1,4-alpha-glucosidase